MAPTERTAPTERQPPVPLLLEIMGKTDAAGAATEAEAEFRLQGPNLAEKEAMEDSTTAMVGSVLPAPATRRSAAVESRPRQRFPKADLAAMAARDRVEL